MQDILKAVRILATQTQEDADRYLQAGAAESTLRVAGNIKFDIAFDAAMKEEAHQLRATLFKNRPVWIAGSTHPGEEEVLFDALRLVRAQYPNIVLVLAPRHPERAPEIVSLATHHGETVVRRSQGCPLPNEASVFLIDGVGELKRFYGTADVAFLGGSLIPHGGQNPLEAQVAGIPVLFGPYMMNFKAIARTILKEDSGREVADTHQLAASLLALLGNPSKAESMGTRGRDYVRSNQGALDRIEKIITTELMA
jgi:3-deoxy-D-manno-octulosonic-acid transferase